MNEYVRIFWQSFTPDKGPPVSFMLILVFTIVFVMVLTNPPYGWSKKKIFFLGLSLSPIIIVAIPVEIAIRYRAEKRSLSERLLELTPQQLVLTRQLLHDSRLNQLVFMRIVLTTRDAQIKGDTQQLERLLEWCSIEHPYETDRARAVLTGNPTPDQLVSDVVHETTTIERRLNMNEISNIAIKIMLSLAAFLIAFGLSSFFIRGIFPWKKEKPLFSNFLSFSSAFLLSGVFALWLFTADAAKDFIRKITEGFSSVLIAVISILFISIGVYLFWKKIKSWIKPG